MSSSLGPYARAAGKVYVSGASAPERVRELLHQSGAVGILGNHDEFLLRPDLVASYTSLPVIVDAIDWCRSRLSAASLKLIRGFRDTYELPLHDGGVLSTFHGTPSSNTTDLLATTEPETVKRWVGAVKGNVLAGRTHPRADAAAASRAVARQPRERRNAVSGGRRSRPKPDILPYAEYAIVESAPKTLDVSLRRVALDKSQLRKAALAADFPLSSFLVGAYA